MDRGKGIWEKFFKFLSDLASYIDEKMRFADLAMNRTVGGLLDRAFGICRHSYEYLVLPALLAGIIILGVPEFSARLYLSLPTIAVVFFLVLFLGRWSIRRGWSVRSEMMLQVVVVLSVAVIVWMAGGNTYQKGGSIYQHFFVLSAIVVSVTLIITGFLAGWVWKRSQNRNNYDDAITRTELFISRDAKTPLNWFYFFRSLLTVIPGAPLQLLLLPSILTLLAPPYILLPLAIGTFVVSYIILLMGGFDARLNQMWLLLQSAFFRGGALLVSLIVITLAIARLCDVTYVTTIFDTAERTVIMLLLASAYVLFWWFDYWVNRLLAQELIKLLNSQAVCDAQIPYLIDANCVKTSVLQDGRVLQIHGASRFIVIGSSKKDAGPRFQTHSFDKMFETLATGGFPGGKATPSPGQIAERIFDFKCLAGTVLVILSVMVGLYINCGVQKPQLKVNINVPPSLHLAQLLDDHTRNRGDEQPALIIAASGGGTRAALYTAAVMEGLAKQGKIEDVIMGSGVSGGGAALAYFAGKRPALVKLHENAWNEYFDVMSKSFIKDVINGALEWRIVSSSRLGLLLTESFEQHWALDKNRNKLGDVQDFGLILNTAVAGQFTCDEESKKCSQVPLLINAERQFRNEMTHSDLAGGRLLLTNLSLKNGFVPSVEKVGGPKGLPVIVDDPTTRLEVAAALNANFPPVFSNAAIDVGEKSRYWVTDGGTVDNRGIEMLLYTLRNTLRDPQEFARIGRLPAITVVVVDASAFSNKYAQDRGIGTMMDAGTQFASLLVQEQLQTIQALYEQKGQLNSFKFVYLPMPTCLRESGSFGTHWMLQPNIKIDLGHHDSRSIMVNLLRVLGIHDSRRSIKGSEMIDLLREMHCTGRGKKLSTDAQAILDYAVKDNGWNKGARELGFIRK